MYYITEASQQTTGRPAHRLPDRRDVGDLRAPTAIARARRDPIAAAKCASPGPLLLLRRWSVRRRLRQSRHAASCRRLARHACLASAGRERDPPTPQKLVRTFGRHRFTILTALKLGHRGCGGEEQPLRLGLHALRDDLVEQHDPADVFPELELPCSQLIEATFQPPRQRRAHGGSQQADGKRRREQP